MTLSVVEDLWRRAEVAITRAKQAQSQAKELQRDFLASAATFHSWNTESWEDAAQELPPLSDDPTGSDHSSRSKDSEGRS